MAFLKTVHPTQREGFRYEKAHYNFQRVLLFSVLFFFLHIIFIGVDFINYKLGRWDTNPDYQYIFYSHLVLEIVMLGFIGLFAYHYWKKAFRYTQKELINSLFVFFILFWSATVSLIDQSINGEITVFIMACVAIFAIMVTSHLISFALLFLSSVYFIAGMHFFGLPPLLMQSHAVNIITVAVVSWFLSRIIYSLNVREFENRRLIESKSMDLSEAGVWDYNFINHTVQYSLQWKNMLGYKDSEIPDDSSEWIRRVHPSDKERVLRERDEYMQGLTKEFNTEYRMMCKDGSYIWILDRARHKYTDENGKIIRVIGTHTDITDLKKKEESLNQAIQEAEAAATSKNVFLANISNEFNAPLQYILESAGQLGSQVTEAEQLDTLNRIHNAGSQLRTLIQDVMDYSRIEAGTFEIHNAPFNLSDLMTYLEKEFRNTAEHLGFGFYSNGILDPSARNLLSDEKRISQILQILFRQALSAEHTASIGLEYSFSSGQDKGVFRIALISHPAKNKTLPPLKISDPSDNLSLFIVRHTLNRLKGKLEISDPEPGAKQFTITLNINIHANQ